MNESLVEFGSLFFSKPATAIAGQVDSLFTFILWVSILLFLLVFGAAAVFVYTQGSKNEHKIRKKIDADPMTASPDPRWAVLTACQTLGHENDV